MKSKIYYAKSHEVTGEPMRTLLMGFNFITKHNPDMLRQLRTHDISETHQLIAVVDETDLEKLFHDFQGEVWSPKGEAKELISGLGLRHTSMSVGDIVQQGDKYYLCDNSGFKEI